VTLRKTRTTSWVTLFGLATGAFLTSAVAGEAAGNFSPLSPNESQMIVLRASGSMWGATENTFSQHAFSLKSGSGIALWKDTAPETIVLINPENKTYISEPLAEYIADNNYAIHQPLKFDSVQTSQASLPDGKPAVEIIFKRMHASGHEQEVARIKCLKEIKLPTNLLRTWARIMLLNSNNLFPVSLKTKHVPKRHTEKDGPVSWSEPFTYHSIQIKPIDKNNYKIPADYKRAEDKSAFYFSSNGILKQQDVDDLFRRKLK